MKLYFSLFVTSLVVSAAVSVDLDGFPEPVAAAARKGGKGGKKGGRRPPVCTPADVPPFYYSEDTGNFYELVQIPCLIEWREAETAAASRTFGSTTGKLVTVETAEENEFIKTLEGFEDSFTFFSSQFTLGPWIGGIRDSGASSPWTWGDGGESFALFDGSPIMSSFTNWLASSEPNSGASAEAYIVWLQDGSNEPLWGDAQLGEGRIAVTSYIVEYETNCLEEECDCSDFPTEVSRDVFPSTVVVPPTMPPHKGQRGKKGMSMSMSHDDMEEPCIKYFELVQETDICPGLGTTTSEISWETARRTARTLVHEGCYGSLASIRTSEEAMLVKAALVGNTNPGLGSRSNIDLGPLLGGENGSGQ
ncbi:MAG: hypothetical protein SGARI_001854, partial [Bacillariaceae sp.]